MARQPPPAPPMEPRPPDTPSHAARLGPRPPRPASHTAREAARRARQPSLFNAAADEPPEPAASVQVPPDPPAAVPPAPPATPAGEKAKARDLLAAVRTLKAVEAARRPATAEERAALRKFGGFGPVARHVFPDPATGGFKPGWEEAGRQLQALLTPDEYGSGQLELNPSGSSPVPK